MVKSPKPLRSWARTARIAIAAAILGGLILLFTMAAALSGEPTVRASGALAVDDLLRVRQLLKDNDPREMKPGAIRKTTISERELNLLISDLLARAPGGRRVAGRVTFSSGEATIQASLCLPENPMGAYLNVALGLAPFEDAVRVTRLRIGWVRIPSLIVNGIGRVVAAYVHRVHHLRPISEATGSLKQVLFKPGQAHVIYQWRPGVVEAITRKGQYLMFSASDRRAILHYHKILKEVLDASNGRRLSLAHPLKTLFLLARLRTERGGDPVVENRLLILTLGAHCLGKPIQKLVGATPPAVPPADSPKKRKRLTLHGRIDLAQHYMISAALAALAGNGLADFAGIFKEVSDSSGGSGFSFADLLADHAGVRMGELAVESAASAKALQARMSLVAEERAFMPDINEMPEGLDEAEFKQTYTDLDSAVYRQAEAEINRRVATCDVFRSFGKPR